ncbi:hypothetical protein C2845_PM13G26480 [Panicum miliaceum]|uniref:Uncharacterized protein n=1 Tax=Panicum miliaceum TaxID=4540 RepID=A0A3L6RFL9_PANMI|nr:hypothetical protein C2845_PM13G26480 [Panicum miliaceum]
MKIRRTEYRPCPVVLITASGLQDVRIGIGTGPMLRDGIKFAVAARAEDLKKFCSPPDSKGAKYTVEYLYGYMIGGSSHYEIPSADLYESAQLD